MQEQGHYETPPEIKKLIIETVDERVLPKVFCVRGHIQPLGQHNIANKCHKCTDELVTHCPCGAPFDLWYDFKADYMDRVVRGRDYCSGCLMITPWSARWLLRPSDAELSRVELALLERVPECPQLAQFHISNDEIKRKYYGSFLDLILRRGIAITDKRHPKHTFWIAYNEKLGSFTNQIVEFRKSRAAANRKALEKVAGWRNLTGREFEIELGRVLRAKGFAVTHVGGPGDSGADLLIEAADKRIVVQCKAHSKRIGPGPVRDLYGCLQHHRACEGWLVSLEGYSDAAFQFAHMKPLQLLTISEILK